MHVMDALSVRNGNVIHKQTGPGALVFYPEGDLLPPPYQLRGDGMIRFTLHYPAATSVVLRYGTHTMDLSRQDDTWTAQCAALCGFQRIQVILDGSSVLCPCFPIGFMENQPCNYIDLTESCQENITSGSVVSEFFYSKISKSKQRILVYLPPQYHANPEQRFPVLYLQHGHGENETAWIYQGKVHEICDRLIWEQEAVPMIIVMACGMVFEKTDGGVSLDFMDGFERMLLTEIIPLVDRRYRTLSDRKHRAMAGLSMGSLQTTVLTMKHPDIFSAAGLFSGFVQNPLSEDQSYLAKENLERYPDAMDIYFRAIGDTDEFLPAFSSDDVLLQNNGISCIRRIYSGGHEWNVWKQCITDFIRLIFKEGE